MIYLSESFEGGGGSSFPQQELILKPRAGDLYIWLYGLQASIIPI